MKIRNSLGHLVDVPKKHEAAIRKHIQSGNHQKVSDMVDSFKPKMADGGKTGHNWAVPMYGWGQNGLTTGPYQDGGEIQPGQMQAPPTGQTQTPQQGPQDAQQGGPEQQLMQVMDQVEQALKQGVSPKDVLKTLTKEGIPKKEAQHLITQVMQHSQQEPVQQPQPQQDPQQAQQGPPAPQMKYGGIRMAQNGTIQTDPSQSNFNTPNSNIQAPTAPYPYSPGGTDSNAAPPAATQQPNTQVPGVNDAPYPGATGQLKMKPSSPWSTGDFYADRSIYAGNKANTLNQQYQKDAGDPNVNPDQLKREHQAVQGNQIVSDVSAGQSVANAVETGVGLGGKFFADSQARKQEMGQQYYNNVKNRAMVNPYTGDNTAPAFSKFGSRIPFLQAGGIPTSGSDFQSGNPNVLTEKGETISDPNRGPAGPDGAPTGVVVHDQTGDAHSDPSGGNLYNLGPDAVVHPKVLGIKVGDFLDAVKDAPKGAYIAAKVTEKYPNPNKEVSFAKLSALFDTKTLAEEVESIGKKVSDIEKKNQGNQATKVTQTTEDLNKKTLASQIAMKKQEMADNSEIAGATGPIHNITENLKASGAYGPKIQKEHMETQNGNPPTADKGVKMRGKKLLVPMAQNSIKMPADETWINFTREADRRFGPDNTYYTPPTNTPSVANDNAYQGQAVNPAPATPTPLVTQTRPLPTPEANIFDPNTGRYANTGYNDISNEEFDRAYPNLGGGFNKEHNQDATRAGTIIPMGRFTGQPNLYNQAPNDQGSYGKVGSWSDVANQQDRQYFKTYAQDYAAKKKFGVESFDQLTPAQKSEVTGWSPVTKDASGKYITDPDYTKYHQNRFNQTFQEEHGYPYYDPSGKIDVSPWAIDSKSGEVTFNEPLSVRKSYGSVGAPDKEYSKTEPVVYINQATGKPEKDPAAQAAKVKEAGVQSTATRGKTLYQEGLAPEQIAQPLAELFMRRDPAPYIEDQGAKNALAANTRQQFVSDQAQRNEIQRGLKAATQYGPQNNQAANAQYYANAWTAQNNLSAQTAKENAEIQKRYEDTNNALREKAGSNRAVALDTLAKRTAEVRWKQSALDLNAIGNIAEKRLQNRLENRTGIAYQTMFNNAGWDPYTGSYVTNANANIQAGAPDQQTTGMAQGLSAHDEEQLAKMEELHGKAAANFARANLYAREKMTPKQQLGGKVKRINPKRVKSK